jgi:hypothetical protein
MIDDANRQPDFCCACRMLSLTCFIFTGGFERFPRLKMVCAHVGGTLPMLPALRLRL